MKRFKINTISLVALGIFAYVATFVVAAIQSTEPFVNTVKQVLPKTVMLKMETELGRFLCAGVFISPAGHILTCNHCVDHKDIKSIAVESYNGYTYFAEVLSQDKTNDLALLKVNDREKNFPYAKLADPRYLNIGQEVLAVGYSFGMDWTVTHGIISALNRDFNGDLKRYNMLQTDTFINPGNSGGPLFDRDGKLVAINSFIFAPVPGIPFFVGFGFSVEAGQIIQFLTKFRQLDKSLPKSIQVN